MKGKVSIFLSLVLFLGFLTVSTDVDAKRKKGKLNCLKRGPKYQWISKYKKCVPAYVSGCHDGNGQPLEYLGSNSCKFNGKKYRFLFSVK